MTCAEVTPEGTLHRGAGFGLGGEGLGFGGAGRAAAVLGVAMVRGVPGVLGVAAVVGVVRPVEGVTVGVGLVTVTEREGDGAVVPADFGRDKGLALD